MNIFCMEIGVTLYLHICMHICLDYQLLTGRKTKYLFSVDPLVAYCVCNIYSINNSLYI